MNVSAKPQPKPIPKFVKTACYQSAAYFIYNIMGFACISVPIQKKQIQMYTNTQTLDLTAFVSRLSILCSATVYILTNIILELPRYYRLCLFGDAVNRTVCVNQSEVQTLRNSDQDCTALKQLASSPPSLPFPVSSPPVYIWTGFFQNTLLKEMKVQGVQRGQLPRFTVSLVQQIITMLHPH